MPEIPQSLDELQQMQSRISAGQLGDVPIEYVEELNRRTRAEQFETRYSERLTPDYISSKDRTETELRTLHTLVRNAYGEGSYEAYEIRLALDVRASSPDPDLVSLNDIMPDNYVQAAAYAESVGNPDYAATIMALGEELVKAEALKDANDPETVAERVAMLKDLGSEINKVQTQYNSVNGSVRSYLGAADSAYRMSQLVAQEPDILTTVGGDLSSLVVRVVGEFNALKGLLADPDATVTRGVAVASIDSYGRQLDAALADGSIDAKAHAYAMFNTQEMRLAFQIARSQQGDAGVISNQDYTSALNQVRGSRVPNTWADSLRGLIMADEFNVTQSIEQLRGLPNFQNALEMERLIKPTTPIVQNSVLSLEDRAVNSTAAEAYAWLKSGSPLVPTSTVTPDTAPTVPQGAIDKLKANPDLRSEFEAKYGVSADTYLGE
tara:strand:+ start:1 stop:1311 length:1311 start_codon:yes stop_codon:yes gene_type:complete